MPDQPKIFDSEPRAGKSADAEDQSQPSLIDEPLGHRPRLNILLIEDEAAHAELISRLLRRNGDWDVRVDLRRSISAALPVFAAAPIHVVLTDLDLPDSRGLDTLHTVREHCGDIPVLVLTSTDDTSFGRLAVKSGADDYLVKSDLSAGLLARAVIYSIERRRAQRRIRQATLELKRNVRDLEDFARIVSHDLKTPLAVIRMDLDQAQSAIGKADRESLLEESIESAHQELDFTVRLIDDLSMFARLGGKISEPQELELLPLIQRAVDRAVACYPHIDNVGPLRMTLPSQSFLVFAHESMLHQLFENLVGNALKYHSHLQPDIRIGAVREGDRIAVTVADNGLGIPEKDRARVLKMFERISGRDQIGTGIGLAISDRIAEMHGGPLEISEGHGDETAPGTTFRFTLPTPPQK